MNGFGGNNDPYNIFDKRGRRKNKGWSVAAAACSILSFFMCILGWAGLILGFCGIAFAIVSRVKLGYFNSWSIAGILIGIFGMVFSGYIIFFSITNPELIKEIFGFTAVPGIDPTTTGSNPNNMM